MGILDSIGALIPGSGQEPTPQSNLGAKMPGDQPAAGGGTWTDLVKNIDPNFLKSFGAQLMVGSPGGIAAQFGPAVAKGFEGENLSEQANHERAVQQQQIAEKNSEAEKGRTHAEKLMNMQLDTKEAIAHEKILGMIERSRLIRQPNSNQEMKIVSDAMNKFMTDPDNSKLLSRMSQEQKNEAARGYALGVLDTARNASGVRSQGQTLPTDQPGAASAPPSVGSASSASSAGSAPVEPTAKGTSKNPILEKMSKDPNHGAQFQQLLSTQEGRKQILENPKLDPSVRAAIMQVYGQGPPTSKIPLPQNLIPGQTE